MSSSDRVVRFVPAPGWPSVKDGWLPDSTWEPPSDWPSALRGWAFYRGPYGEPVEVPQGHWVPVETDGLQTAVTPIAEFPDPALPEATTRDSSERAAELAASVPQGRIGRRVVGAFIAAIGVLVLAVASLQISDLQRDRDLHSFGNALQTDDCTLAGFGEKLGYDTPASTSRCKDRKPDPTSQAIQAAQNAQGAGGVIALAGSAVMLWPTRKRPI